MEFRSLILGNVLEAGEDYVSFSATLTLMPGENSSNSTTVTILDDQLLELYEEVFEIKMELAAEYPFSRVSLMFTPRNVTILDNEGKLRSVPWFTNFIIFLISSSLRMHTQYWKLDSKLCPIASGKETALSCLMSR